jgi:hypothetical protein
MIQAFLMSVLLVWGKTLLDPGSKQGPIYQICPLLRYALAPGDSG